MWTAGDYLNTTLITLFDNQPEIHKLESGGESLLGFLGDEQNRLQNRIERNYSYSWINVYLFLFMIKKKNSTFSQITSSSFIYLRRYILSTLHLVLVCAPHQPTALHFHIKGNEEVRVIGYSLLSICLVLQARSLWHTVLQSVIVLYNEIC